MAALLDQGHAYRYQPVRPHEIEVDGHPVPWAEAADIAGLGLDGAPVSSQESEMEYRRRWA
jgi:hypothetical protein